MSSMKKLIAECEAEDVLWEKETAKHFEDQREEYQVMFDKIKSIKDRAEKSMDNITKGLDSLVSHKHTIEKALEQTENLYGLPIPPEQQENAIDLVNKMTKFMNNTQLITSPNPLSPKKIHEDVATYTADVAQELKDCVTDLNGIQKLYEKTQLLHSLITSPPDQNALEVMEELPSKLYNIIENEESDDA